VNKTATVRARVEPSLKSDVENILSKLGLTASEAIHILYRQIKLQKGLPFDVRIPNEATARTLRSARAGRRVERFKTKQELFRDLGM
jgi:DNA-damage-inducible protein J